MIARGTGGEFSVRGGCRACVMGVLFTVLSHIVVEVYLPALPISIAAPPSNSCECSVQCAPPGLRFGGCSFRSCAYLELSKVPACHSSKTVKGRSYQRSLKTTHTYGSDCRNNKISGVGSARAEVCAQPSKRSSVMYAPPRRLPSCASKRVPLLHPSARASVSTTGPRPKSVGNLMFLVRRLQFLSCFRVPCFKKPQS